MGRARIALLAVVLPLSSAPASVLAGPPRSRLPEAVLQRADKHHQGKLGWALYLVALEEDLTGRVGAAGRRFVDERTQRVTAVAELYDGVTGEDLRSLVAAHGGRIEGAVPALGWVKLSLPPRALRHVSDHAGIKRLRPPFYPTRKDVVSEGAAMIHAPEWIARTGRDGTGVTVAVLDSDYAGVEALVGSELPAGTEITPFVAQRLGAYVEGHGTACAEVVHDVAPGAQIVLFGAEDDVSWATALGEIADRAIPIVSHSLGFDNLYPSDGQSWYSRWANYVSRRGVTFVTAAGNEVGNYYKGGYRDVDADGLVEFDSRTEYLPVGVLAGGSSLVLRWNETYQAAAHDYDLFIVTAEFQGNPAFENNPAIVASSQEAQDGSGYPLEWVHLEVDEDQVLYAVIRQDPGSTPDPEQRFSLWSYGGVAHDYMAVQETLCLPADAAGALAVAAVNLLGGLEGYSSRGPTDDGRVKPDIAAPTQVSTASYGPGEFWGTSAATPHVAGAAALLLSARGVMSAADLRQLLAEATPSRGEAALKNNDVGYGRLDLSQLP
jgi:subtilisin family serine protease